jgi:flagellar hook-length control protein FliK
MQEMASVTRIGSSMAALGFTAAVRQTEGVGAVFDDVLSTMMALTRADPPPRSDLTFSRDWMDLASRAGGVEESTLRLARGWNADDPQQVIGAEGRLAAARQPLQFEAEALEADVAKPAAEGAGNVPNLWDVQSQTAALKSGFGSAQGNQSPAYAQTISGDDASKQTAQASSKAAEAGVRPASQSQMAQTGSDGKGDSRGGMLSDGKGSGNADGGKASSASSEAAGQSGDAQSSKFAQRLSDARGTARADQAETIDKIVKSMTMAVKRGESEVRMVLQPPRLGSVRIELSMKDGVLNASFETQTQATRHAISGSLPQLKAALENQGIEVGGFNVTVEQESGQSKFPDDGGLSPSFTAGDKFSVANEEDDNYDIFDEKRRMSAGTSLVDYFV